MNPHVFNTIFLKDNYETHTNANNSIIMLLLETNLQNGDGYVASPKNHRRQ